jgi:hypothetical protein
MRLASGIVSVRYPLFAGVLSNTPALLTRLFPNNLLCQKTRHSPTHTMFFFVHQPLCRVLPVVMGVCDVTTRPL